MNKRKKVLILTNKEDITADYVILELQGRNIDYFRFNTEEFPLNISGTMYLGRKKMMLFFEKVKHKINFNEICSIWYRRPGKPLVSKAITDEGIKEFCSKESEEFLEGFQFIFQGLWVSYPPNIFRAQNKLLQLSLAKDLGFNIPETIISNNPKEIQSFANRLQAEIVTKAVRQGILKFNNKEHLIFTNPIKVTNLQKILGIKYAPCIFQEFIPKKFDIRVNVIGNKVFAVEIHIDQNDPKAYFDWRRGDQENLYYRIHTLPKNIETLCKQIVKKMGLNFGAIDLIYSVADKYYFLEINPNGQWAWLEQKANLNLSKHFVDLLIGEPNEIF